MQKFWVLLLCKNDGVHFQKNLQFGSNRLLGLVENNKQSVRKLVGKITDCIAFL